MRLGSVLSLLLALVAPTVAHAQIYVTRSPTYVSPASVTPVIVHPAPAWSARFGLGARATGSAIDDGWNTLGGGAELLYRVSPHVVSELAGEYQRSADRGITRTDVPITVGLRLHIGRPDWVVSPYFAVAGGVDFANEDLKLARDGAFYLEGQLGGGLELRLGQHLALNADARADFRKRADSPSAAVVATSSIDGVRVRALGDGIGAQLRVGLAVYF